MRLYVVRHYKTICNSESLIMGWGDSPPADGWETDLLAVSKVLKKDGVKFDRVYTSDLKRARATGEFYTRQLSVQQIESSAALNEVNYGKLFRKSKKWVVANVPEYKTDPEFVFPDGESFNQMQARSVSFVEGLAREHSNQSLLLVVHAGVIRGLICHYLGLPYGPNLKRRVSHRYIGIFNFKDGVLRDYDEKGSLSSLVKDGVISIPWKSKDAKEN